MTKNELRTGDIIVTKAGYLGVVLKDEEYILYQTIGIDWLWEFTDDLRYDDPEYTEGDIMQIYRDCSFVDIDEHLPEWERDESWCRPTAEEIEKREKEFAEKQQAWLAEMKEKEAEQAAQRAKNKKDSISIVTQYFYGNRTGTEIKRERVDYFLRGHLDESIYASEDIKDVNRQYIHVPGAEHIVIVYDQTKEDKYINEDFPRYYAEDGAAYLERWGEEMKMQVSCTIPEIGVVLHTRCFACRMDENGVLQSLEEEDYEKFMHYFPIR